MAENIFIPIDDDKLDLVPQLEKQIQKEPIQPNQRFVWITPNGQCYHKEGCSYNMRGAKVTLHEAIVLKGRRACKLCNP